MSCLLRNIEELLRFAHSLQKGVFNHILKLFDLREGDAFAKFT
jgi:hypothetical protein